MTNKLNASIPANNWKIIELYNKIIKGELDPSPDFQRKLVWKKQHKYKFIETILLNFPFPEVYIAPGQLDVDALKLKDMIVDGQQRCTTIRNYIEGNDVFAFPKIPIKKFSQLDKGEKEDFLNYEVSIRYLKNATLSQIKDIFQKINSTEYSLNATERINAQWGESEFIFFGKQIIEKIDELNLDNASYILNSENRNFFRLFFVEKYQVFDENDLKRMLALQYILTILATLVEGVYFNRNSKVQKYIETFNEEFVNASIYENKLIETVKFIDSLNFTKDSYWFNKSNLFTMLIELSKFDTLKIDKDDLKNALIKFEADYKEFAKAKVLEKSFEGKDPDQIKYFEYSREGVNETTAREHRGNIINKLIVQNLIGMNNQNNKQ